jgi:hypothetical protein
MLLTTQPAPDALSLAYLTTAAWLATPSAVCLQGAALAESGAWQALLMALFTVAGQAVLAEATVAQLAEAMEHTPYPLMVVQGDDDLVLAVQQAVAPTVGRWPWLPQVISQQQGLALQPQQVWRTYGREQAQAINVMRHGACLAPTL